jgi:6-phosphogluconolactonase
MYTTGIMFCYLIRAARIPRRASLYCAGQTEIGRAGQVEIGHEERADIPATQQVRSASCKRYGYRVAGRLRKALLWMLNLWVMVIVNLTLAVPGAAIPPGQWLLVGTYSSDTEPGVYVFRYEPHTGQLESASATRGIKNPSFLAVHPSNKLVYAVSEVGSGQGRPTGAVVALRWDRQAEVLRILNVQPSGGDGPCHLVVDPSGRMVLVAHYASGSVSRLLIDPEGKLAPDVLVIPHTGSSVNPQRQTAPHAHHVMISPDGRFAIAADLGADRLFVSALDAEHGQVRLIDSVAIEPGSGPRHIALHPSGKYIYVINELANTITAMRYQASQGKLEAFQTVSTLPEDYRDTSYTAEIVVHPSGRFVYGSNRGHDSIAIFAVDEATGRLRPVGHQPTGGRTPRNFNVDPAGRYLLVANQNSDSIVVFTIDQSDGRLTPAHVQVHVPRPVCLKWLLDRP